MSYNIPIARERTNLGNVAVTATVFNATSIIWTDTFTPGEYLLVADWNLDGIGNRTFSFRCYENGSTAGWDNFDLYNQDGSPQDFDIPMTLTWSFTVSAGNTKTVDVRVIVSAVSAILENAKINVIKLA